MNSKQLRTVLTVTAGVILLWILSPLAGVRPRTPQVSGDPLQFNAARALEATGEFVAQCPERVFGSLESRPATGFLRDTLQTLGYEWDYLNVEGKIDGHKEVGRDILGYKAGPDPEIIAIVAHYDTAPTTVQGAADNGSGVGVLIELARILAERPARKSILIVFTDGGEWGMLGARDLARRYPERSRIAALLSLDHVDIGDLAELRLDETGLKRGFTPPWYRLLAFESAKAGGLPVQFSAGLEEHLDRTFYIPWTDQGPFLAEGIPAVNLSSRSVDSELSKAVYHSPNDTIDNLKPAGIKSFGIAAERIVRTLDALPSIPSGPADSFRLSSGLFLNPGIVGMLHWLLFVPLPLCIFFHLRNHSTGVPIREMGREILAYLATILPMLMFYMVILLIRVLKRLPSYELYPATAKDPILQEPAWGVLAVIAASGFIIGCICAGLYMFAFRKRPRRNFEASKTALLCLMLAVVAAALVYNSYWAVTVLALPCWIWSLVGKSLTWPGRLWHWLWISSAAIPGCLALWRIFSNLSPGSNFLWYLTLSLSNGLFSARGFILGTAAVALGIRFLVIQLHRGIVAANDQS
jgi:hypothetical protein